MYRTILDSLDAPQPAEGSESHRGQYPAQLAFESDYRQVILREMVVSAKHFCASESLAEHDGSAGRVPTSKLRLFAARADGCFAAPIATHAGVDNQGAVRPRIGKSHASAFEAARLANIASPALCANTINRLKTNPNTPSRIVRTTRSTM